MIEFTHHLEELPPGVKRGFFFNGERIDSGLRIDIHIGYRPRVDQSQFHHLENLSIRQLITQFRNDNEDHREQFAGLLLPFSLKSHHFFTDPPSEALLDLRMEKRDETDVLTANIQIVTKMDEWENTISMAKMINKMEGYCLDAKDVTFTLMNTQSIGSDLMLTWVVDDHDETIGHLFDEHILRFEALVDACTAEIQNNQRRPALVSQFDFPPDVRTACEQYLLYFASFLADLGIKAEASIEGESGSTLFTVIPKDATTALNQIKDALTAYLTLPNENGIENISELSDDISVRQLHSQVVHLKSQLSLAHSMIQTQLKEMQAPSISHFNPTIFVNNTEKQKNEESILNGLIKVKEYDGPGFSVNLPEIVRKLKRNW